MLPSPAVAAREASLPSRAVAGPRVEPRKGNLNVMIVKFVGDKELSYYNIKIY